MTMGFIGWVRGGLAGVVGLAMAAACTPGGERVADAPPVQAAETAPMPPIAANPPPVIIAHRGASGERPEHTIEAYRLAIEQGADFIEPDLVMTRDGVLVARHDPWLSDSTDVAERPEFADRKRTVISPEGEAVTDWWSWDFTLAELATLRAKQVRAGRPTEFDGQFSIPTYDDIVALMVEEQRRTGRGVGMYPETKWPVEHAREGLDMEEAMVSALYRSGWAGRNSPVIVQSFEPEILKRLNARVEVRLVQLVYPLGWLPGGEPSVSLEALTEYADGVGPYKALVLDPQSGEPTDYTRRAKALGLVVHPWTFRDDDKPAWAATPEDEIRAALAAGVDGVFTDFPATGVRARADVGAPR
jgi:glycerophosphoryl diester phosphodiesterase